MVVQGAFKQTEQSVPPTEFFLQKLDAMKVDSATGPDMVAARVLKQCSAELAPALRTLVCKIVDEGRWPSQWRHHWIVPLHKRRSMADPRNYRGIHLTPHLSKVAERAIKEMCEGFLSDTVAFGANQFAHQKGRGARDAVALLTLSWLSSLEAKKKVVVYCADVA